MNPLSIPKDWTHFSTLEKEGRVKIVTGQHHHIIILGDPSGTSKLRGSLSAGRYNEFIAACDRVKAWVKNLKEDGKWDVDDLSLIEFCIKVRDDVKVTKQGSQVFEMINPRRDLLVSSVTEKLNQAKKIFG